MSDLISCIAAKACVKGIEAPGVHAMCLLNVAFS